MTIPIQFQSSNYPNALDTNVNLHEVHDSLRVVLASNYDPNDPIISNRSIIYTTGDNSLFPSSGIITLTDQCNDIENRAISFYYTSKTSNSFEGLVPTLEFENKNNIIRAKKITNVTQNVMAEHHNSLKDSIIAVENFIGTKGLIDRNPFGETMEGRINFLRKIVLSPRAWFTAKNKTGLVPLTVSFKNESFKLGEDSTNNNFIKFTWDFGDQDQGISISDIITISATDVVPISYTNVYVQDLDSNEIKKTYVKPGNYHVKLIAENEFGSDFVLFENYINAKTDAPEEAIIDFVTSSNQTLTPGDPIGGPYDESNYPKIKSKTDKIIDIQIQDGINSNTNRSFSGEELDVWGNPIDPIEYYTWQLSDDLEHINEKTTKALYSIGGIYDLTLRCDTKYGSYRITNYFNAIDIIEDKNLWLFTINNNSAVSNEFGLVSETFKTGTVSQTIHRNNSFLNNTNNSIQAKKEFAKNTGFCNKSTVSSGDKGTALIYYSSGGIEGSALSENNINFISFGGFDETFNNDSLTINRPWNWISLPIGENIYFLFGADPSEIDNQNKSYQVKDTVSITSSLELQLPTPLINPDNFINGANELIEHVTSEYDMNKEPLNGRFATYRETVRGSTGYFLRNDGVGNFYKIKEFYKTEGTSVNPVNNIRKLQDMTGSVKLDGELVNLTNGLFFFNNSGNVSAYNITSGVWETGSSISPFRSLQDKNVDNYNNLDQTLLATSDNDRNAYLSYDYSTSAFIKYNSIDKTFHALSNRIVGEQWILGIY